MAEDCERNVKRQKKDIDDIFYRFYQDETAVKRLQLTCFVIEQGANGYSLVFNKVIDTNARASRSFSEADVVTEEFSRYLFPVGDIFVDGIDIIKKCLDKQLPEDKTMLKALSKLLQFFYSLKDHEILIEEKNTAMKGHWAITVAQHLLAKLAVYNTYTVDTSLGVISNTMLCLCREHEEIVGEVGDTSYGCAEGWHGSADILMDESVPIKIVTGDQAEEFEDQSVSSDEIKLKNNFSDNENAEMIAQTIVFSFLQNNKGNLKQSFVPGIGISSESLRVYFYDSENDLLISSLPVDLFSDEEVWPQAVVFLWLTLNYKLFCSGSTEKMKTYKAGFFDNVGEQICLYKDKEKLTRPCSAPHQSQTTKSSNINNLIEPFDDKRKSHIAYFKVIE